MYEKLKINKINIGRLNINVEAPSSIHIPSILFVFLVKENKLGSVVGIATGYELDGPGIESRWGRYFPHLSRPALGPTQPPV